MVTSCIIEASRGVPALKALICWNAVCIELFRIVSREWLTRYREVFTKVHANCRFIRAPSPLCTACVCLGLQAPRLSSVALCPQEHLGGGGASQAWALGRGWSGGGDWSTIGLFSKPQSYHLVGKPDLLLGGSGLGAGLGSRKPRKWPSMPCRVGPSLCMKRELCGKRHRAPKLRGTDSPHCFSSFQSLHSEIWEP